MSLVSILSGGAGHGQIPQWNGFKQAHVSRHFSFLHYVTVEDFILSSIHSIYFEIYIYTHLF